MSYFIADSCIGDQQRRYGEPVAIDDQPDAQYNDGEPHQPRKLEQHGQRPGHDPADDGTRAQKPAQEAQVRPVRVRRDREELHVQHHGVDRLHRAGDALADNTLSAASRGRYT